MDLSCGACKRSLKEVIVPLVSSDVSKGLLHLAILDFPLGFTPREVELSIGMRCAHFQGKAIEYLTAVFEQKSKDGDSNLNMHAKGLGLSEELFSNCLADPKVREAVKRAYDFGKEIGIVGTPTLLLNGSEVRPELSSIRRSYQPVGSASAGQSSK
jgi:protein-disulfide isomerase